MLKMSFILNRPVRLDLPSRVTKKKSIYELLNANDKFTYVIKAVNFTGDYIDVLNDTSSRITFFAPPNWAFRASHNGHRHGHEHDMVELVKQIDIMEAAKDHSDGKENKRRKQILQKIARAILSYHIIPTSLASPQFSDQTTVATNLTLPDGSNAGQPLRVKIDTVGFVPRTTINFFSRVVKSDVLTKNGVIHVISFPLLPPPSAFQELFQVPKVFSTLSSALQRTGLTRFTDLRYYHGKNGKKGGLYGSNATTIFAPTNKAFDALPRKLQSFLFSPYGEHVLKKLLAFHIVPTYILHADYAYNATKSTATTAMPPSEHPQPVFEYKHTLPTLLFNHTVQVHVTKYNFTIPFPGPHKPLPRLVTKMTVNGRSVVFGDIPAQNGAVHVVDGILDPRGETGRSHHRHPRRPVEEPSSGWEDWEDWLPQWAAETL